ncbi:iron-sulfur cluster assembly scaffold protein [Pontixanthobacter aquaemixtae]|uniref:Iron-sulfur cluster assembly scaffold protein n=1 Tax=Pontixanthobacter aquaemixtae TaxID=1958940 RepID=A0A844ZTW7_9SPHN|nr:iron-sulfur cluster assembly scaffold protein [Pontixanthobacter aquaemixtae]MXO90247.1 iron-sulfur cluster assembly scaffold protein [Pontixanthobacter aquaemixtae]
MNASSSAARLYTPDILGLAIELARYPITQQQTLSAEARSRSCGSTLSIGIELREDEAIGSVGLRVSACAIGQASAAIFARDAIGRTLGDLEREAAGIENWLSGKSAPPAWPDLHLLDQARSYPARHEAILLPWKAAISALSKAVLSR